MRPGGGAVRARGAAAAGWLLAGLVVGPGRRRTLPGRRDRDDLVDTLALVLGLRYLLQAAALERGLGTSLGARVSIEALHALSMAAGAVAMPRHRGAALTGLGVALAVMSVDVVQRADR